MSIGRLHLHTRDRFALRLEPRLAAARLERFTNRSLYSVVNEPWDEPNEHVAHSDFFTPEICSEPSRDPPAHTGWVELNGIEPSTSGLQSPRSPS